MEPPFTTPTWCQGDINNDGVVDFDDLWDTFVNELYGTGPYAGLGYTKAADQSAGAHLELTHGAAVSVPEPSTVLTLATGLLALLLWRRRERIQPKHQPRPLV